MLNAARLRNVGLVTACLCVGFFGASLVGAEPNFVTFKKVEVETTAADAAEVVCFLAERTRVKTACAVDAFMSRINVTLNTTRKDADKVCLGMVDVISSNTRLFYGRGWVVRIFPTKVTKQNEDKPMAVCGIR
jgi:hypothetical protein